MGEGLTALLCVGTWLVAAPLLLVAQVWFYGVRRYRCPGCGGRSLRFLVFRSAPWRKPFPVPVRWYACEGCAARFCEAEGVWEREG